MYVKQDNEGRNFVLFLYRNEPMVCVFTYEENGDISIVFTRTVAKVIEWYNQKRMNIRQVMEGLQMNSSLPEELVIPMWRAGDLVIEKK